MPRRLVIVTLGSSLVAALAAAAPLRPDDDLAVVKRATMVSPPPRPEPPSPTPSARPARRAGKEPQWLKVRIVEKGSKKARITVNLPLSLVRAVGDEWPVDWHCGDRKPPARCSIHVSEVLRALDSGQDLVQIDEDDATVRIWVE